MLWEDVSSPRLKVRKGKLPTDTCRHHEFTFLAHFLWNCNFHQLKVRVSTAGRTVAGVLVTFHCETTPCTANKPPWVCRGWLRSGRWWYGGVEHKEANQSSSPGTAWFLPCPKAPCRGGSGSKHISLPPFPFLSQPHDGRWCLPTVGEELPALLHLLLCPAGEDRDYSLAVCASFSSAAAVPC